MEDGQILAGGINSEYLSIIDENPELNTLVEETDSQSNVEESSISSKILSKLSRGYTFYTVSTIIAYSLNEIGFILPYFLKIIGIVPYFLALVFSSIISLYIFYIQIDIVIKLNLFKDYHDILNGNLGHKFNLVYYILNIIYHTLILILEISIITQFFLKLLSFFDIDANGKYIYSLIIILSLILIQFPFSFINYLKKPDFLFNVFISLFILLNIVSSIFFLVYKIRSNNKNNEENVQISSINFFENISPDYFVCFSAFINIIGWQNQLSRQLEGFKIKTTQRFFNIIYLTLILMFILSLITGFINSPLMKDNEENKYKINIFLLEYNNEIIPSLMIIIEVIIFIFFINILIAYRISLIEENFILSLKATIYRKKEPSFPPNKIIISLFKIFILLLASFINLLIKDMSCIIILFGGIFASILNFYYPTIIYSKLISRNSLVNRIALVLSLLVIIINIIGFVLKIIF